MPRQNLIATVTTSPTPTMPTSWDMPNNGLSLFPRNDEDRLGDENGYFVWSQRMRRALKSCGLLYVVDGTLVAPTESTEYDVWEKMDSFASSIIMSSVRNEIVPKISHLSTSNEVWSFLEVEYGHAESSSIILWIRHIIHPMSSGTDVSTHINKFQQAATLLAATGLVLPEWATAAILLSTLPCEITDGDSWDYFVKSMRINKATTLSKVVAQILEESRRKTLVEPSMSPNNALALPDGAAIAVDPKLYGDTMVPTAGPSSIGHGIPGGFGVRLKDEEDEEDAQGGGPEAQINDNSTAKAPKGLKEALGIDTSTMPLPLQTSTRRPGPLDISVVKKGISTPLSVLATARRIQRLQDIEYPEGVKSPREDLNKDTKDGKFRYDRDFLMQFMQLCKEKPPNLPPLDVLGIIPVDRTTLNMSYGGSGRHRPPASALAPTARQSSVGLGITPGFSAKPGATPNPFSMGQFSTPMSKPTIEQRYLLSTGTRSASMSSGPAVLQFGCQDVVQLRDRKWVTPDAVIASTTISAVHDDAAKENAAVEVQSLHRIAMSRGGLRCSDRTADSGPGVDGWSTAGGSVARSQPKAGDLSQFGKITKPASVGMGPSSVFTKKDNKRDSLSRTSSSSNMFSMLSQNAEPVVDTIPKSRRPTSRKPSVDLGQSRAPEAPQRKKLQLLPLPKPSPAAEEMHHAASEDEPEPAAQMSEVDARKKIDEDVKEFFAVRSLAEADVYFTSLPEEHRFRLVDKLVASALESKESDAILVSEFFSQAASKGQCSCEVFESGFMPMAELLDDIVIDAPNAFKFMAMMLRGAGLDRDGKRLGRIAGKSMDSDRLLQLVFC